MHRGSQYWLNPIICTTETAVIVFSSANRRQQFKVKFHAIVYRPVNAMYVDLLVPPFRRGSNTSSVNGQPLPTVRNTPTCLDYDSSSYPAVSSVDVFTIPLTLDDKAFVPINNVRLFLFFSSCLLILNISHTFALAFARLRTALLIFLVLHVLVSRVLFSSNGNLYNKPANKQYS
jgi:hypothetical protein